MKLSQLGKYRKSKGFVALTDLGLAIGATLLVSTYMFGKYEPIEANNTEQLVVDGFSEIIRAASNYRQGVTDGYASLSLVDLTGLTGSGGGSLPGAWADGVGTNPVGGNWTATGTATVLTITATALPAPICDRVATKLNLLATAACVTGTVTVTVG